MCPVFCRVGKATKALWSDLPAIALSLRDFHLTISQALALRSLHFEDKLKRASA